jgi:hypothetical protein
MKIFIICCLLFIHVNTCIFIRGFRVSIRVLGIRSGFGYPFGFRVSAGLVFVMDFHPNRCSVRVRVSTSSFGFGCTETPPRSEPDPLPSLLVSVCSWAVQVAGKNNSTVVWVPKKSSLSFMR